MKCPICNSNIIGITFHGKIRNGGLGIYTDDEQTMYKCEDCGAIWHKNTQDLVAYYESEEYRDSMGEGTDEQVFYQKHDRETLEKLNYTGTDIFRDKTVADIGCGPGAFLDFVAGAARDVIGVEPTDDYRTDLKRKGYFAYPYAIEAKRDWFGKVDVITSFDVIEHVEDPQAFIQDAFDLNADGGVSIIGTPTEAPFMREIVGKDFEQRQLFSVQHLWVFSEKSLILMAKRAGFTSIECRFYQRYGVANMLGWVREKKPKSEISSPYVTATLDQVWRGQMVDQKLADYIVLYAVK